MEQETDYFHLLTQHPVALMILGSLVVVALMFGVAYLIMRPSKRERERNNEQKRKNRNR